MTGIESSKHAELKSVAREYLITHYGFKANEIVFEYKIPDGWVDVAGVSAKYKVAVEVGNAPADRLLRLYKYFDQVVWIPYWVDVATGTQVIPAPKTEEEAPVTKERWQEMKDDLQAARDQSYKRLEVLKDVLTVVYAEIDNNDVKAKIGEMVKDAVSGNNLDPANFKRL